MATTKYRKQTTSGIGSRHEFDGVPVTPNDSTDLPVGPFGPLAPCVGLYITGAGNVNVQLVGGGTAVLTALSAGQYVIADIKRVLSTSTTATGIFALFGPVYH